MFDTARQSKDIHSADMQSRRASRHSTAVLLLNIVLILQTIGAAAL
jgi:hypothetical protein